MKIVVSCPNYSLPIYAQIIKLYGVEAGKEIVNKLHENDRFVEWYGADISSVPFISNHIIRNENNEVLDLRDLITENVLQYESYINNLIDNHLIGEMSYVALSEIYNADYTDNLTDFLKQLLRQYNTSNIEIAIQEDIRRIKNTDDSLLSEEERRVKYNQKNYKRYYAYSMVKDSTFINDIDSLATYVGDEKLYKFYAYMKEEFPNFKNKIISLYENC